MENSKGSSDGEDIPSDFFDDFNKDEFMEGLSVIDSWDDEDRKGQSSRARINAETIDNVRDLRELIGGEEDDRQYQPDSKYKWKGRPSYHNQASGRHHPEGENLDDFIKPGSRRDPNKTNEAIRKDKEVKVKEYLAKHLESGSDLCPPGTELDFLEERKSVEVKKRLSEIHSDNISPPIERRPKYVRRSGESPMRRRNSPPRYRRPHRSPGRMHHSPHRVFKHNMRYPSPHKPFRKYHQRFRESPRRVHTEFRRERRSRSPYKRYHRHSRSRSRSPGHRPSRDREEQRRTRSSSRKFDRNEYRYRQEYYVPPEYSADKPETPYQVEPEPHYPKPDPVDYGTTVYPYVQDQGYSGYGAPYEYGAQPVPQMVLPPQPVPAPLITATTTSPTLYNPIQTSALMVPPLHINPSSVANQSLIQKSEMAPSSEDNALAKLVADGKLSHEDYLKLAPNKGVSQSMDTHAKGAVLTRCHNAMSRLGTIVLPNQLLINNSLIGPERKQIANKFCSPLKRQATTEFHFTKFDANGNARQNKLIVDSIIATLDIEKVIGKPKKVIKDTKDVAVQTTKPFCDACAIRENTTFNNAGTSIDRELFFSTIHTQVIEQDLVNSRSVFNPAGGLAEGANLSIAHMTPAQLVSQLAARAKTLKQSEAPQSSNQYRHQQNYDYDSRGGDNQYRNQYNYRY